MVVFTCRFWKRYGSLFWGFSFWMDGCFKHRDMEVFAKLNLPNSHSKTLWIFGEFFCIVSLEEFQIIWLESGLKILGLAFTAFKCHKICFKPTPKLDSNSGNEILWLFFSFHFFRLWQTAFSKISLEKRKVAKQTKSNFVLRDYSSIEIL